MEYFINLSSKYISNSELSSNSSPNKIILFSFVFILYRQFISPIIGLDGSLIILLSSGISFIKFLHLFESIIIFKFLSFSNIFEKLSQFSVLNIEIFKEVRDVQDENIFAIFSTFSVLKSSFKKFKDLQSLNILPIFVVFLVSK